MNKEEKNEMIRIAKAIIANDGNCTGEGCHYCPVSGHNNNTDACDKTVSSFFGISRTDWYDLKEKNSFYVSFLKQWLRKNDSIQLELEF